MDKILASVKKFFKEMPKGLRVRLGFIAGIVVVLAVLGALLLGRTKYALLYYNLDSATAASVVAELKAQSVPHKLTGTTVMVPEKMADDLRLSMSAAGIISDGGFDYSMYESATGFGSTDRDREIAITNALQENIRAQINKSGKIKNSLVILNRPEKQYTVLKGEKETASASVMLELNGTDALTKAEINGIIDLISSGAGVPAENVKITDSMLRSYRYSAEDLEWGAVSLDTQFAYTAQFKEGFDLQIINLLTPVFGGGNVQVNTNVILNFDDFGQSKVEFAPPVDGMEEGLAVSMMELYENVYGEGGAASGVPGTDSNNMGLSEYPYGDMGEDEYYRKLLREINYELDQTNTNLTRAKGGIEKLSISIILNEEIATEEQITQVRNLVANAIGVDDTHISVERMPLEATAPEFDRMLKEQEAYMKSLRQREIVELALKWGLIAFFGLAVLWLIHTLLKSRYPRELPAAGPAEPGAVGANINYVAGEGGVFNAQGEPVPEIDISAKSDTVDQLEKFIDKDPQAVAQLLRNWLEE